MNEFFQIINYGNYEILFMRLFFAYVLYNSPICHRLRYPSQPYPNGLALFFDLTFLSNKKVHTILKIALFISLVLYVAGIGLVFVVLFLFLYSVAQGSFNNSQGAISHSSQAYPLVLFGQLIAYILKEVNTIYPIINLQGSYTYDQLSVFLSQQAIVAIYFTAAISKLYYSKFDWINQVKYIPIQMIKVIDQKSSDRTSNKAMWYLEKRKYVSFFVSHPNITTLMFSQGLFLEIVSPLSLMNRYTSLLFGILFISFHKITGMFMGLKFGGFQRLVFIYFVNFPYWLVIFYNLIAERYEF